MDKEWLQELVDRNRYRMLGALGGFIFALLVIHYGLLWTLFILLCVGIGYWVGKQLDEEPDRLVRLLERLLDRLHPPGRR